MREELAARYSRFQNHEMLLRAIFFSSFSYRRWKKIFCQ